MFRRSSFALALAALVAAMAVAVVPAGAQKKSPKKAPSKVTLQMKGGLVWKKNREVRDTQRFGRDTVTIRSGGTLTIDNRTKTDPHTVSVVTKSQLPKSFECAVCEELFVAHGADNEEGPPTNPVLEAEGSQAGLDAPGDSVIINPGRGKTALKVSAAKGSTLNLLCAVHPWMQAKLRVR